MNLVKPESKALKLNPFAVNAIRQRRKSQTRRVMRPQPEHRRADGHWQYDDAMMGTWWFGWNLEHPKFKSSNVAERCPYGQPGDQLVTKDIPALPKLTMTDLRVERLQDITEADAIAEGLKILNEDDYNLWYTALGTQETWPNGWYINPRVAFFEWWDTIYPPSHEYSSQANPWVWVVSFGEAA